MTSYEKVRQQLKSINADFQFVGRAELRELPKILFEDEILQHVVFGRYVNGFALLCATNQRILLIDKKPLYLTLEDIRYDMISDMRFSHRLLDTSVVLGTVHKPIRFISYNQTRLREMTTYVQKRVMDSRRQHTAPQLKQPISGMLAGFTPSLAGVSDVEVSPSAAMMSPYRNPVIIRRRTGKFFSSPY